MKLIKVSLLAVFLSSLILYGCSNNEQSYGSIQLLTPANGEFLKSNRVNFSWNYTGKMKGYFRLFLGSAHESFHLIADNLRSTFYSAELTGGNRYYWKVAYVENGKVRVVSKVATFYGNLPPTIPVLKYPGGGARDIPVTVTLQWYPSKDSTEVTYEVYLGKRKNDLKKIATLLSRNEFKVYFLSPGTIYYWKVVAIDAGGTRASSVITSFTTTNNPESFYLVEPQNTATGLFPKVTFKWVPAYDPDGDPVTYEFYLGVTDTAFVKYADSLTSTSFTLPLTYSTIYYWKVVAKDNKGGKRSSIVSAFMTDRPPLPPILLNPENGEKNVSLFAKFSWKKATDPDGDLLHYYFYLGDNPVHLTKIDLGMNKASFVSEKLRKGTTYYWKVRVYDGKGLYAESPINHFTTTQFTASSSSNLAAGAYTTFFIDSLGGLWGGGRNTENQVGVPGKAYYTEAVPIKLPGYGAWVTPSSEADHTCAITTFHELYCWGNNLSGQCGVDGYNSVPYPVKVTNPSGSVWLSVDTGVNHTCAIDAGNYLYCWGDNSYGEFGNGTTVSSSSPVSDTSHRWESVSAGNNFTCGITLTDGMLYCWGNNSYGIMGDSESIHISPVRINNDDNSKWLIVAAGGDHVCGIDENFQLWCWGRDDKGQIGNGVTQNYVSKPYKVIVNGVDKWRYVAVNKFSTCAIDDTNSLYCWGDDSFSKLGDMGWGIVSIPERVVNVDGTGWKNVAVGYEHICAFDVNDNLWCWGRNTDGNGNFGQLLTGRGLKVYTRPLEVFYPENVTWINVSAGGNHTCGINAKHELWCWGNNMEGELGVTEPFSFNSAEMPYMGMDFPVKVENSEGTLWKQVAGGYYHTCALDINGKVWCWGYNFTGSLGWNGGNSSLPVSGITIKFNRISAGGFHNCGLTTDGVLYCWGNNFAGQLGTGDYESGPEPRAVKNPDGAFWKDVCTGEFFTCAIDVDGVLWCWGDNRMGEIGRYPGGFYDTPQIIQTSRVDRWEKVACGMEHVCAIGHQYNGLNNVYCWGRDDKKQANTWSNGYLDSPHLAAYDVKDLWAGGDSTCILGEYASTYFVGCWGANNYGQLGLGYTSVYRYYNTIYDSAEEHFSHMGMGLNHVCAVTSEGTLLCWGGEVVSDSRSGNSTYMSVGSGGYWVGFPVKASIKYK